jgi:hypothetical protein
MRFVLTCIVIALNSALGFSQEAEFFVKQPTHKFPKTNEGKLLEHTFVVTNTGKSPLVISGYKVECTCTKAFLPKEPILPGKSGVIKITFDSEGKAFYQDRIIYLETNTKRKTEKIRFKVYVEPKAE